MNSVSWLLYIAEVSENIRNVAVPMAGMGILGSVVGYGFSFAFGETWSWQDADEKAEIKKRPAAVQKVAKRTATICIAILALAAFAPSRTALMLIAASEVGETVLASPEAQEMGGEAGALATDSLRVLRKFINEQLAEPAGEAE